MDKATEILDKKFTIGAILIAISGLIFCIPLFPFIKTTSWINNDRDLGLFFINYALAFIYFFVAFDIRRLWKREINYKISHTILWLILCLISCYALNRQMNVFQESVTWFSVALISSCIALVAYIFKDLFHAAGKATLFGVLGAVFALFAYLSVYLAPIYVIGILASFVIGVSLHTFVPLIFCIILVVIAIRAYKEKELYAICFAVGFVLPVIFTINFATKWSQTTKEIQQAYNRNQLNENTELPNWVYACQKISHNWISERVFKSNLVYVEGWGRNSNFFGIPNGTFDAARFHDPLVTVARWLSSEVDILDTECVQILRTAYDARHQAQEKLWSGDNLSTANVTTYARIYPDFRMAYTEKTLKIHYTKMNNDRWEEPQEALYTFYLPEGGVVSSLSLWINGKEEKGYLTTKAKADSAYKTVVGVERRDPSLVHWQEGNTITVRVFPCTSAEDRQFKIGITAPLKKQDDILTYQSIYFQGHATENATESIKIQFTKDVSKLELPFTIDNAEVNNYFYEGDFKPYWEVNFANQTLATQGFSFGGKTYTVKDYAQQYQNFEAQNIYLDLNNSWNKSEFEDILAATQTIKNIKIYAFQNKLIEITAANQEQIFEQMQKLNFSLFPLHIIKNPETSLVISKSEMPSPNLKDLENSIFAAQLKSYLSNNISQICLYNLGENLSPYLKTLKELRVFNYDNGTTENLISLLYKKQFVKNQEDASAIVITQAAIKLVETQTQNGSSIPKSDAPDHLLRLYTYNDIMRKINSDYFSSDYINENLISKASTAYIVSPLSSLIVLETQQDYDRFGIKASENSLQNASMKSSGAVPEPHEWALIICVLLVLSYLVLKGR